MGKEKQRSILTSKGSSGTEIGRDTSQLQSKGFATTATCCNRHNQWLIGPLLNADTANDYFRYGQWLISTQTLIDTDTAYGRYRHSLWSLPTQPIVNTETPTVVNTDTPTQMYCR